jgi:DNA helicase HerA-like ATPase
MFGLTRASKTICGRSELDVAISLLEELTCYSLIGISSVNLEHRSISIATHDPRSPRAVVGIRPADLLRSVYVVGKTGTGKSTFLENLLLRSADAGFGVALIDPHGDLFSRVLENLPARHWNRVAILRPADAGRPVGVNLLGALAWGSRTLVASGVIEVFRTLWGPTLFGPRSEHVLRNAVLAVLENPNPTLLGLLRFLIDAPYRARALSRITDPVVRIFWIKEFPSLGKSFASEVTAPVLNKLGALASPVVRRLVGQAAPRMDFRELMDEGRILVVDLSGIGRDAAQFIGALIVTGLDLAAHARAGKPAAERSPFLVVADEFHTYMTRSFVSLLSEGRKFGVCAALAHQHAAQLDPEVRAAILGNAGTLAAFTLSAEDAETIAPEFEPELVAADLVRLRRHHMALRLLRNGEATRPMIVRTLPPAPIADEEPQTLLRISAERYGRPAKQVDREISEALGASFPN